MKSFHKKMSFEEFERIPERMGWKKEYYGGKCHITPSYIAVDLSFEIDKPIKQDPNLEIRCATETDRPDLETAYASAFTNAIEYCDWEPDKLMEEAKKWVGRFHKPPADNGLPLYRVAVIDGRAVAGAEIKWDDRICLRPFTRGTVGGPMLRNLFVAPDVQRKGIATGLVAELINLLAAQGRKKLWSSYILGNEVSHAWHIKFGFQTDFEFDPYKRRIGMIEAQRKRLNQGSDKPKNE
jgi:GNAT superfamily N-acetyltransferase